MVAIIDLTSEALEERRSQRRLRDGSLVTFRPLEAGDVDALRRLFYRLSPETVYLRFFQPIHEPPTATLQRLAAVDHDRREAIAAVVHGEIVAVARYDRPSDDATSAEVAIVVEDAWQHRGLGLLLFRELTRVARRHGVTTFTASVLGENRRMLLLAKSLNPAASMAFEQGQWELAIPLTSASGWDAT